MRWFSVASSEAVEPFVNAFEGNVGKRQGTIALILIFCFSDTFLLKAVGTKESRQVVRTVLSLHCSRTARRQFDHVFSHVSYDYHCSLCHVTAVASLQREISGL